MCHNKSSGPRIRFGLWTGNTHFFFALSSSHLSSFVGKVKCYSAQTLLIHTIMFTDSDGYIQTGRSGGHYTVNGRTTPQQHSHATP